MTLSDAQNALIFGPGGGIGGIGFPPGTNPFLTGIAGPFAGPTSPSAAPAGQLAAAGGIAAGALIFNAFRIRRGLKFAGSVNKIANKAPWRRIMQALGIVAVADLIFNIFGFSGDSDDVERTIANLLDDLDAMQAAGILMMPSAPRGDSAAEPAYLTINFERERMWMHYQYFSQKSMKAARATERTKSFRGTGGRKQARTRDND